jgi:hypothetical protein
VVTILVSKNGGRYRLQGETMQALWLPLQVRGQALAVHLLQAGSSC